MCPDSSDCCSLSTDVTHRPSADSGARLSLRIAPQIAEKGEKQPPLPHENNCGSTAPILLFRVYTLQRWPVTVGQANDPISHYLTTCVPSPEKEAATPRSSAGAVQAGLRLPVAVRVGSRGRYMGSPEQSQSREATPDPGAALPQPRGSQDGASLAIPY